MSSRVLVVYYSRSGMTKTVAESIAEATGGDLEEIVDHTNRSGILGYLRSGYDAARHRLSPIDAVAHEASTYDLVIVGTPIWNLSVSSPVRTYLHRHRGAFRNVAFFCTCGGRGGERAFAQMAELSGAKPIATLVVRDSDVPHSAHLITRFVAEIDRTVPVPAVAVAPATGSRPVSTDESRRPSH